MTERLPLLVFCCIVIIIIGLLSARNRNQRPLQGNTDSPTAQVADLDQNIDQKPSPPNEETDLPSRDTQQAAELQRQSQQIQIVE